MLVWFKAILGNIYHAKFEARVLSLASLRTNGPRECAPDDGLREAIQFCLPQRELDCFVASAPRNDGAPQQKKRG
jgi:hypothetical protein